MPTFVSLYTFCCLPRSFGYGALLSLPELDVLDLAGCEKLDKPEVQRHLLFFGYMVQVMGSSTSTAATCLESRIIIRPSMVMYVQ